jgi:arylsulfatase A-like enzyme
MHLSLPHRLFHLCKMALGLVVISTSVFSQAPDTSPNILWFVVDDMSAHLSCYGETAIKTPHIDRLAAEGTRFTRAYVTAPVCSTCRSALITGMYQTTIGAHHHRSGRGEIKIHLPEGVTPVPALFQQAGYYTCIGSGLPGMDHRGMPLPAANAKGKGKGKPANRRPLGKTDYNFEWDLAIYDSHDWADRGDKPFFMQVQLHGGKLRNDSLEANRELAARARQELGSSTDSGKRHPAPLLPTLTLSFSKTGPPTSTPSASPIITSAKSSPASKKKTCSKTPSSFS